MPKQVNVFINHAKADSDQFLIEMLSEVSLAVVADLGPAYEPEVTLARDAFEETFKQCGGWQGWAREMATGIHPTTRQPRYHVFVCLRASLGAASALIVKLALGARKPVFQFHDSKLIRRYGVEKVSSSWKDGWELT